MSADAVAVRAIQGERRQFGIVPVATLAYPWTKDRRENNATYATRTQ